MMYTISQLKKSLPRVQKLIRLPRFLDAWDTTAFLTSTIIGSGIFVSPKEVMQEIMSPGQALVVWFFTGLVSLLASLCYAELGMTFRIMGSDYVYIKEAFGSFPAFLFVWVAFVFKNSSSRAILALTFSNYFLHLFFNGCPPPEGLKRLIAGLVLSLLTALQCRSTKWSIKLVNVLTVFKLIGHATIIALGVWHYNTVSEKSISEILEGPPASPSAYALAFYSAFWAYSGIQSSINIIEEVEQPVAQNLIVSILASQITSMVIYILTNLVFLIALSPSEILTSDVVGMTFGHKLLGGQSWLMSIMVAFSTLGTMITFMMSDTRSVLAAARNHHVPRPLALISADFLTPIPTLIATLCVSIVMLCVSRVEDLILYTSYIIVVGLVGSILSLIFLRFKRPGVMRPMKLPLLLPALVVITLLFLLYFPFYLTPKTTALCFVFIAVGVPLYIFLVYSREIPKSLINLEVRLTLLTQKFFFALPEDPEDADVSTDIIVVPMGGDSESAKDNMGFEPSSDEFSDEEDFTEDDSGSEIIRKVIKEEDEDEMSARHMSDSSEDDDDDEDDDGGQGVKVKVQEVKKPTQKSAYGNFLSPQTAEIRQRVTSDKNGDDLAMSTFSNSSNKDGKEDKSKDEKV